MLYLIRLFSRYVLIDKKSVGTARNVFHANAVAVKPLSKLSNDSSLSITPVKVSKESIKIYENYLNVASAGGFPPKPKDMDLYRSYLLLK